MRREGRRPSVSPRLSNMMKKTCLVFMLLLALGAAHAGEQRIEVPVGDSPSRGPVNAPVTIIEFIDFQ